MNKRILSLLLVAIMLICMIPAVSLVSYADESQSPAVGTYEYYEHMWYDDGHLLSFVDMTHMTQDDIVANSETLKLENSDYRMITGKTGFTTTEGLRTFVKITDGKNAGKYYLVTTDYRVDAEGKGKVVDDYAYAHDANGVVAIPVRQDSGGYNHAVNSGIWIGHSYIADDVVKPFEKGYASASFDLDSELDSGSADALNSFTVNMVYNYRKSSSEPNGAAILSVAGYKGDENARFTVGTGDSPFVDGVNSKIKDATEWYGIIGSLNFDKPSGEIKSIWQSYNGRFGGNVNFGGYGGNLVDGDTLHAAYIVQYTSDATFKVKTSVLTKSGDWKQADSRHDKSTVITSEYPSCGAHVDLSGLTVNTPNDSSMYFLRVYDCELNPEQMAQNHFADLCYYYNIDLTEYNNLTRKLKQLVVERAQKIKLGDETYGKSDLEDIINNVLLEALPDFGDINYETPVVDSDLAKYIDLYYDDGHLMSMLKLSDVDESTDVVHNGEGVNIDGKRVVLGNLHEDGGKLDSYVRILAGKYAGDYYLLGNQGDDVKDFTLQIEIDEEGFIKYNEPFHQYGARMVGVMYSYTYAEADLNTVKPRPKETSDFLYNAQYIQHDGTYGSFTQEGVYRMICSYFTAMNPSRNGYAPLIGVNTTANFGIAFGKHGTAITSINTGGTNEGALYSYDMPVNETYHYMARCSFTDATTMYRSLYFHHNRKGLMTTRAGVDKGYDFNQVGNDRTKFTAVNRGSKMYFLRFYDVSLTPAQMKQNHFADLCYYYGLENTDRLQAFGSYLLTEEFYDAFLQYSVGMCDAGNVASMQSTIDSAIKSQVKSDKVIESIASNYNSAVANATTAAESLATVEAILNGIDVYIEQVESTVAVNSESALILADCAEKLMDVKDNVSLYYLIVTNYNENVQSVREIATAIYNATNAQLDTEALLANNNALEAKMCYTTEGAAHASKYASLAAEGNAEIARLVAVAKSANAQTTFDFSDYVRFAGYQIRVTDFAAMRALFAVDTDAIAAGYTYGDLSYDILCMGFALIDESVSDFSITYDGEHVTSSDSKATVRSLDKWSREPDMDGAVSEITAIDGEDAYSLIKAYDGADLNALAGEYQKEYVLKIFAVIEGEGTGFIRYFDVESVNLGSSMSLYRLAKCASEIESADNLAEDLFITRVITTVDGKES